MASTAGRSGRSWKKILLWVIGIAFVLFLLIQLVPYGRSSHTNPPASNPFQWTDPQAEAIAKESCYDCHSNETKWWWATNIAPFSWLVQRDVDGGRARLNFSEWDGQPPVGAVQEIVQRGRDAAVPVHDHPPRRQADRRREADVGPGLRRGDDRERRSVERRPGGSDALGDADVRDQAGTRWRSSTSAAARCHPADQALSYRTGDPAQAQALIDDMIQRGAQVSSEEQTALVQYFTR